MQAARDDGDRVPVDSMDSLFEELNTNYSRNLTSLFERGEMLGVEENKTKETCLRS